MRLVYKAAMFFVLCSVILLFLSSCTNNVSGKSESYGNISEESAAEVSKSTTAEDEAFTTSESDTYTTLSNQTDFADATWETFARLLEYSSIKSPRILLSQFVFYPLFYCLKNIT